MATLLAIACGGTGFIDAPGSSTSDGAAPDADLLGDSSRVGTGADGATLEDGSPDANGLEPDAGRADANLDAAAAIHDASADAGSPMAVPLGAASDFAVLAGSTVTIAPVPPAAETFITGDVGTSPNATAIGVFSAAQPDGQIHAGDAVSLQAEADLTTAYDDLFAMPCLHNLTGTDLGTLSLPLPPGVYCFDTSAELTGTLTLDAQNDPNAVWVFQIGSTLKTAATNGHVTVINGTPSTACHVYWAIGSSATLNTGATFVGNVVTLASITMTVGVTLSPGRALARNGGVTLEGNTVSQALCQ
jgi:Ice-binding-like